MRELKNRGSEKASPLKKGAAGVSITGTLSLLGRIKALIAVMVARATARGSYVRPHPSQSTKAEPLISNPAQEIVLASFSAQLTAAFLQLLVAPSLLRSSLNRFPARLVRHSILEVVMLSPSARARWGRGPHPRYRKCGNRLCSFLLPHSSYSPTHAAAP